MKLGDLVKTPKGMGVFFEKKEDKKALVILKEPTEEAIWYPLVDMNRPVFECFKCDFFKYEDISLVKTAEERQREAEQKMREEAQRRQAEFEARIKAHNEAVKRQQQQQQNKTEEKK